jgi:hypothetical protein
MSEELSLNIKGPNDTKLSVTVPADASVADLKAAVEAANADFPKDQQRLIFSGRVLKDEDPLTKYGIKNGVAIHLVRPSSLFSKRSGGFSPFSAPLPLFLSLSSTFASRSSITPPSHLAHTHACLLLRSRALVPPEQRMPPPLVLPRRLEFHRTSPLDNKSLETLSLLFSTRSTREHSAGTQLSLNTRNLDNCFSDFLSV